ncbi:MAG: hypothetical protein ACR2H6_07885 [Pyrinomonadaceae bacterium]
MADKGTSGPTHTTGTAKGEDVKDRDGKEAGRDDAGTTGAGRPTGTSTARDSTSINPEQVESTTETPEIPPA